MPKQNSADRAIVLENAEIRAVFSPLGARITSLNLLVSANIPVNVALGLGHEDNYLSQDSYVGAVCGRYANRIRNGRYTDPAGNEVQLATNEGATHLHGGITGFDRHVWQVEKQTDNQVVFGLSVPDGDQGYPGAFNAKATYRLEGNRLRLEITATSDRLTPVNMTSHAYWNLTGRFDQSAAGHELQVHADQYLPIDDTLIPQPGRTDVTDTPFDFRTPAIIADHLPDSPDGFDHNFCLQGGRGTLRPIATLRDPQSGRSLEIASTEPGLQFYLSKHFNANMHSADGTPLHAQAGIALEPQTFPDSPNRDDFPSPWLKPGETYHHVIEWKFGQGD